MSLFVVDASVGVKWFVPEALAEQTQRTVYDCLYAALAVRPGGQMVTADDRLVNGLNGTPWAASVIRLQDVL